MELVNPVDPAAYQPISDDLSDIDSLDSSQSGVIGSDGAGWVRKTYAALKTSLGLGTAADANVGDFDAAGAAATVDAALTAHDADTTNVHGIADASALALSADVIPKSLVDAAGDLIVGSADNTVARLAKGADGTFLGVFSGALAYAAPSSSSLIGGTVLNKNTGTFDLNYALPGWRFPANVATWAASSDAPVVSEIYFIPIYISGAGTFDNACIGVTTAAASSTARIGLYAAHATSFAPDSLLYDWGTVDCSTTGDKLISIAVTLDPGLYWLAWCASSTSLRFAAAHANGISPLTTIHYGGSAAGSGTQTNYRNKVSAGTPAASGLPASAGTTKHDYTGNGRMAAFMRYNRAA